MGFRVQGLGFRGQGSGFRGVLKIKVFFGLRDAWGLQRDQGGYLQGILYQEGQGHLVVNRLMMRIIAVSIWLVEALSLHVKPP